MKNIYKLFKSCLAISIIGFVNQSLAAEWNKENVIALANRAKNIIPTAGKATLKTLKVPLESAYLWAQKKHKNYITPELKENYATIMSITSPILYLIDKGIGGADYAEKNKLKRQFFSAGPKLRSMKSEYQHDLYF